MKKFLAVDLGSSAAMNTWKELPEAERKEKEKVGMGAWSKWAEDNKKSIVDQGAPPGKTKRVTKEGISDIKNEMGAYNVVEAESHEEAAKLFENHPHFTMFPGEAVEVMEYLPIPGGK